MDDPGELATHLWQELAQRRDAYDLSVGEERYLERCSLKTARLFESACRVGRIASGRPGAAT